MSDRAARTVDEKLIEELARLLHEAGREAVSRGLVVRTDVPIRPFVEWADLAEEAREGRRVQARFLAQSEDAADLVLAAAGQPRHLSRPRRWPRVTHTVVTLEVTRPVYEEIERKLRAADYGHVFTDTPDGPMMDMSGIGLLAERPEAAGPVNVGTPLAAKEPCGVPPAPGSDGGYTLPCDLERGHISYHNFPLLRTAAQARPATGPVPKVGTGVDAKAESFYVAWVRRPGTAGPWFAAKCPFCPMGVEGKEEADVAQRLCDHMNEEHPGKSSEVPS